MAEGASHGKDDHENIVGKGQIISMMDNSDRVITSEEDRRVPGKSVALSKGVDSDSTTGQVLKAQKHVRGGCPFLLIFDRLY